MFIKRHSFILFLISMHLSEVLVRTQHRSFRDLKGDVPGENTNSCFTRIACCVSLFFNTFSFHFFFFFFCRYFWMLRCTCGGELVGNRVEVV